MAPSHTKYSAYDPNGVIMNGGHAPRIERVTVASGNVVAAYDLAGNITASGKFRRALAASNDGSQLYQTAVIMLEAVDATSGDKDGMALVGGDFDPTKVVFGTGMTYAAGKVLLAKGGLHGHPSYAIE